MAAQYPTASHGSARCSTGHFSCANSSGHCEHPLKQACCTTRTMCTRVTKIARVRYSSRVLSSQITLFPSRWSLKLESDLCEAVEVQLLRMVRRPHAAVCARRHLVVPLQRNQRGTLSPAPLMCGLGAAAVQTFALSHSHTVLQIDCGILCACCLTQMQLHRLTRWETA